LLAVIALLVSSSNLSSSITGIISGSTGVISALMAQYGYLSVAALMALESASMPVPSEIVMPLAGLFAARGAMDFLWAFLASLAGTAAGIAVDYYIAYFIEKDVVYRYMRKLHVGTKRLDEFTSWFEKNGSMTVFITRLMPVVREVVSFPAGFAKMDQRKFFAYSLLGSAVWNLVLMLFGFYALNTSNAVLIMVVVGAFAAALYAVYVLAMRRMRRLNRGVRK